MEDPFGVFEEEKEDEKQSHELVKRVVTDNEVFVKYPVLASEVS